MSGIRGSDRYRAISISDYLIDVLEAHQEEQEELFGEIDLVFTSTTGTLINPGNFRRDSWYPLREKADGHEDNKDEDGKKKTDFRGLRFHDLRPYPCYLAHNGRSAR